MVRVTIPEEVAAEVMFLADRTCRICRDPRRKVEIHHIDGDPSHNDINNLSAICKDCHSDAHTTQAFARNLTPALIRKYNESWREIVRIRIMPGGEEAEALEYRAQILLEIYLIPHHWLNRLLDLFEGGVSDEDAAGPNRWEYLERVVKPTYSKGAWEHYRPLFEHASDSLSKDLERIVMIYGDALKPRIKLQVQRTTRCLRMERAGYLFLPKLIRQEPDIPIDRFFQLRFSSSIFSLSALSTMADREREILEPNKSGQNPMALDF
ncbi:HNH endonuclease signature motif containing protein [Burkholderia cepacia]|uniref:HNH endonuclease signature motif containing protein n=1 Tax=Burkholderia cepacia TaxID=292 RepID=UPI000AB90723|nr:HNH endonuclease signature motif containing protein [Burkholderia cepacia]